MKWLRKDLWFGLQIGSICLIWWCSSSALSIVNKITLQHYPYPLTIALSSCLNNVLYAIPLIKIFHITTVSLPTEYLIRTVVPISIGRAVAITSAYFALWKVSVSYAQTIKATMPIFTVLIARFLLGERQSLKLYFSLCPIVVGVFIATATELQFDLLGLCSSLMSTAIFAFLNVLAKKVFDETGMHPVSLLALNSQLAAVLLFPFWVFTDGHRMWWASSAANNSFGANRHPSPTSSSSSHSSQSTAPDVHFLFLLSLSGLCSFLQNLCAFLLIHQLTTLSYAVTNTAKRIFVIILSLVTLRNPVTPLNAVGMFTSIFGVFLYNRMKSLEHGLSNKGRKGKEEDEQKLTTIFRRREPIQAATIHHSPSDVRVLLN